MKEKERIPAGLGKLYFTTADDKNLEHLQEVKLRKADFDVPDDVEHHWEGNQVKGFTITGTATLEIDKVNTKNLRKLMYGQGRLPRKEKKRRVNSIMRNRVLLTEVALSLWIHEQYAYSMIAGKMFSTAIKRDENGHPVIMLKSQEGLLVEKVMLRIKAKQEKIIRRNYDIVKEKKRQALRFMQEQNRSRCENPIFKELEKETTD